MGKLVLNIAYNESVEKAIEQFQTFFVLFKKMLKLLKLKIASYPFVSNGAKKSFNIYIATLTRNTITEMISFKSNYFFGIYFKTLFFSYGRNI